MIRYVIPALLIATSAHAQCYYSDGTICNGTDQEQYNIQQYNTEQQQNAQIQLQNDIYQMQQQLNQLQSDEGQ